ncbi:MAG: substrate-binding domain-containing protein [Dokdonella sp.]
MHIELQPFSTISGLDAVASGKADLAGSARGAHEGRIEEANLNFIPQALDAIVPVVHPRNPITGLSLRQLRQIYLGRVRNWKEVGGLDATINLYAVAAPMDGIEYTMRQLLYGKGTQGISAPRLYINTGSMEEGITLDPNALGLSTLSVVGGRADLKMLSVAGVAPSVATVQSGSYPLYATLYLVTRASDPKQAMIDGFLAFMATPEASQSLRDHRLVPIGEVSNSVERNQTRVAFIESELAREPVPVPGASPGVDVTPVSAPNATAAARIAVAPAAESTVAAQQRAAREQAARAADAEQTAKNQAATDKAKAERATPIGKK